MFASPSTPKRHLHPSWPQPRQNSTSSIAGPPREATTACPRTMLLGGCQGAHNPKVVVSNPDTAPTGLRVSDGRWSSVAPGGGFLELCGEAQEDGFVTGRGCELHPDRESVVGPVEGDRHGGLAGHVEDRQHPGKAHGEHGGFGPTTGP